MVYVPLNDRVRETATNAGTADFDLAATSDFLRFAQMKRADGNAIADGDTFDYAAILGSDWEVAIGTLQIIAGSPTTYRLLRPATPKASSNAGAKVNFGAGTKDIFNDAGANVLNAMVRTDTSQPLTSGQQEQARANILGAPVDALGPMGIELNGGMEVDQDNAGAAKTLGAGVSDYVLDGVQLIKSGTSVLTSQQVTSTIAGHKQSLKFTVATAQASIGSDTVRVEWDIEGSVFAKAAWGSAAALPISVMFKIKLPLAGSYGSTIANSNFSASASSTFTIATANSETFVVMTFAAQTSGTWASDNTIGGRFYFFLAGSFQSQNCVASTSYVTEITGLKIIAGLDLTKFSSALLAARLPAVVRPFDQELFRCRRYFETTYPYGTAIGAAVSGGVAFNANGGGGFGNAPYRWVVPKRSNPTVQLFSTATGASGAIRDVTAGSDQTGLSVLDGQMTGFAGISGSRTSGNYYQFHAVANARL